MCTADDKLEVASCQYQIQIFSSPGNKLNSMTPAAEILFTSLDDCVVFQWEKTLVTPNKTKDALGRCESRASRAIKLAHLDSPLYMLARVRVVYFYMCATWNSAQCVGSLYSLFYGRRGWGQKVDRRRRARSAFLCSLIVGRQQWGHPACKVKIKRGPLFDV